MPRATRKPDAPESVPETDAPESVPETDAPTGAETDAPETDGDAPETDAPETDAGAEEEIASLAELASSEEIVKAQRVFDTIAIGDGPCTVPDASDTSRSYALQRERRADGSHGPIMLAVVTRRAVKGAKAQVNAQRYPLAEIESARAAFLASGVRLFRAE